MSITCKLEAHCKEILSKYPKDIPERCLECTDLLKFTIETIVRYSALGLERDQWDV